MLRMLLLALAAWSLLRFFIRLFRPRRPRQQSEPADGKAHAVGVLVKDPVCGTYIERESALIDHNLQGVKQYFCSEDCRRKAAGR